MPALLSIMKFSHYTIRLPEAADAPALFTMVAANKQRLADYFPITVKLVTDAASAKKYIEEKLREAKNRESYSFIIYDTEAAKPAGMVFVKRIDWSIPKAELGYYIDEHYTGKGLASESLNLLTTYCFDTLKLRKLILRIAPDNKASRRVAEKNGFEPEGLLKKDFKTFDGRILDLCYYGKVRQ